MKINNYLICILLITIISFGQQKDFDNIKITTLTERSVLVSGTQFNVNLVAINSDDGIILIDTGISPEFAAKVRDSLVIRFHTQRFKYIINTHHHWDHVQGNQLFIEADIIGHKNCAQSMIMQGKQVTQNPVLVKIISEANSTDIPPPPPSHILKNGESGYVVKAPTIEIDEKETFLLSDLTVDIFYYGEGHSNNDIIIHIPEEKLLIIGDIFFKKSLPAFSNRDFLDVERWLNILNSLISRQDEIDVIVPGHNELMSNSDLLDYRNYISAMWTGIKEEKAKGSSLDIIKKKFGMENKFIRLLNKDMLSESGGSLHEGNIEKIWNQIK